MKYLTGFVNVGWYGSTWSLKIPSLWLKDIKLPRAATGWSQVRHLQKIQVQWTPQPGQVLSATSGHFAGAETVDSEFLHFCSTFGRKNEVVAKSQAIGTRWCRSGRGPVCCHCTKFGVGASIVPGVMSTASWDIKTDIAIIYQPSRTLQGAHQEGIKRLHFPWVAWKAQATITTGH